jgi:hypothetical protein
MEGEEIFGSCKRKTNLAPESRGDSHKHNHVNFFHPHVDHLIVRSNVEIEQLGVDQIHGNVEVLEAPCEDGVWHIEKCPPMSHVQCFVLQKSTNTTTKVGCNLLAKIIMGP